MSNTSIDPDRLRLFMRTFFGYGSWSAPLWFVGTEEGGGDSLDEIARRLDAWNGSELIDLRKFHAVIGGTDWFSNRPPIQRTWGKLCRTALAAEGRNTDTEAVRLYQRDELARPNGTTTLIELFPLPSRSTNHWIYSQAGVPEIASRERYVRSLHAIRMERIQSRIREYQPAAVVIYGRPELWAQQFALETSGNAIRVGRLEGTVVVATHHPTARGATNRRWEAIGRLIPL